MNETDSGPVEPDEVLPPEGGGAGKPKKSAAARAQRAFGPIVAGLILDFADLATMGPVGLFIGAAVGFWLASVFKLPLHQRIIVAAMAAGYCMLPYTRMIPFATLVGAYIRFREG